MTVNVTAMDHPDRHNHWYWIRELSLTPYETPDKAYWIGYIWGRFKRQGYEPGHPFIKGFEDSYQMGFSDGAGDKDPLDKQGDV